MADNLGFSNPYLDQAIGNAQGDLVRSFNLGVSPSIRGAMARSGSFGNSGLEQMGGEAERQLQQSLGRVAGDMRYQDYWNGQNLQRQDYWNTQNFDRSTYNDAFTQGQAQFGNIMSLLNFQNTMNQQNLGLGTQIQNTPLNYYQGFLNMANGVGQGFSTSTSNSTASGSPLMGALGGAQLGSLFAKNGGFNFPTFGTSGTGTTAGNTIGGNTGMWTGF